MFVSGGTEEPEHLPLTSAFRRGLVGCVSDLSVGQMFNVALLKSAASGRNVENCSNEP